MPFKTWTDGEEVDAGPFNSYVQQQIVATFPDAATRDQQWPNPPIGACSALVTNPGVLYMRTAGAWVAATLARYGADAASTQSMPTGAFTNVTNFVQSVGAPPAAVSGGGITMPTGGLLAVSLRAEVTTAPTGAITMQATVYSAGTYPQMRATLTAGITVASAAGVFAIDAANSVWSVQWYNGAGTQNVNTRLSVWRVGA
jgi:hypothetical protein